MSYPEEVNVSYLSLAKQALARAEARGQMILRPDTPGFAEILARLLPLPLDRFPREGCPLEVSVPWLEGTLWFVPGEAEVEALLREGVAHRGQIWTPRELEDLLTIPGLTQDQVQTIAQVKLEFGGEVVSVSRQRENAEAP